MVGVHLVLVCPGVDCYSILNVMLLNAVTNQLLDWEASQEHKWTRTACTPSPTPMCAQALVDWVDCCVFSPRLLDPTHNQFTQTPHLVCDIVHMHCKQHLWSCAPCTCAFLPLSISFLHAIRCCIVCCHNVMMLKWSWKVSIPILSMQNWNQTQPMGKCHRTVQSPNWASAT